MSKKSKYAFASLKGAEKFQQKFGGKIANFTEAFASAKQSLSSDIAMTDKKRQAKMYPMGKKIYTKKCKQIDPDTYSRINLIKADLKSKKLCGDLQEKQAQAVALYLWDVKRFEGTKADQKIQINKKDKCPVCGMFVYKYPKWAAQIVSIHNDHKHQFSFDGVKDMMKFYFDPEKWSQLEAINAKKIVVTDYYTQKAIDAKKAWYVSGSDQLGPMGNELIPFKTKHNAETFKSDHAGKSIIQFYQITPKMLKALDE